MSLFDSSIETYGKLFFFRKDDETQGTPYPLCAGETTIGSSSEADVRLKLCDHRLEEIHCIVNVEDSGKATIINKSQLAPVTVNNIPVRKSKVLTNLDILNVLGKRFQYFSDQKKEQSPRKPSKQPTKPLAINKRNSVSHPIHTKSPKVKTKMSMTQKKPIRRKSTESSGAEFIDKKTPLKQLQKKASTIEKPKTTSKVLGSKTFGSHIPTKVRRFSLGNVSSKARSPKKQTPKISARNITLGKSIISSTIQEESPKIKKNMSTTKKNEKAVTPKKKDSLIKTVFKNSARKSLKLEPKAITEIKRENSINLINFSPPRKSIMKTSFRRSNTKLSADELSKMVTFSPNSKKRSSVLIGARNSLNSDETEILRLSSSDAGLSPLDWSEGSGVFDSDSTDTSMNRSNNKKGDKKQSFTENANKSKSKDSSVDDKTLPSRRLSKDNPRYYSQDLITIPRRSGNTGNNEKESGSTPNRKSTLSLTTSTPMPPKTGNSEDKSIRRSSANKSLHLNVNSSEFGPSETEEVACLTPDEQKGRQSLANVVESEDLLTRLSPIKVPIRKSMSNRLSRSVLEKTLSELSDTENVKNTSKKGNRTKSAKNKSHSYLSESSDQNQEQKSFKNVLQTQSSIKKNSILEEKETLLNQSKNRSSRTIEVSAQTPIKENTNLSLRVSTLENSFRRSLNNSNIPATPHNKSIGRSSIKISTNVEIKLNDESIGASIISNAFNESDNLKETSISSTRKRSNVNTEVLETDENVPKATPGKKSRKTSLQRESLLESIESPKTTINRSVRNKSLTNVDTSDLSGSGDSMNANSSNVTPRNKSRGRSSNKLGTSLQRNNTVEISLFHDSSSASSEIDFSSIKVTPRNRSDKRSSSNLETSLQKESMVDNSNKSSSRISRKMETSVSPQVAPRNRSQSNVETSLTLESTDANISQVTPSNRSVKRSLSNLGARTSINKSRASMYEANVESKMTPRNKSSSKIEARTSVNTSRASISKTKEESHVTPRNRSLSKLEARSIINKSSGSIPEAKKSHASISDANKSGANISEAEDRSIMTPRSKSLSNVEARTSLNKSHASISETNEESQMTPRNRSLSNLEGRISVNKTRAIISEANEGRKTTPRNKSLSHVETRTNLNKSRASISEEGTKITPQFRTVNRSLSDLEARTSVAKSRASMSQTNEESKVTPRKRSLNRSLSNLEARTSLNKSRASISKTNEDNKVIPSNRSLSNIEARTSINKSRASVPRSKMTPRNKSVNTTSNDFDSGSKHQDTSLDESLLQAIGNTWHDESSSSLDKSIDLNLNKSGRFSASAKRNNVSQMETSNVKLTPNKSVHFSILTNSSQLNDSRNQSSSTTFNRKSSVLHEGTPKLQNSEDMAPRQSLRQSKRSTGSVSQAEESPRMSNVIPVVDLDSSIKKSRTSKSGGNDSMSSNLLIEFTTSDSAASELDESKTIQTRRTRSVLQTDNMDHISTTNIRESVGNGEIVGRKSSTKLPQVETPKTVQRSKSLDKIAGDVLSSAEKIYFKTRRGKSLATNVDVLYSESTSTDSDNSVPARRSRGSLLVPKHLESITNSSYKESFGDPFNSSQTSTPRKSVMQESKNTTIDVSGNSPKGLSTSLVVLYDTADVISLNSTTDSLKENRSILGETPTPRKSSRRTRSTTIDLDTSKGTLRKSSRNNSVKDLSQNSTFGESSTLSAVSPSSAKYFNPKTPTPRNSKQLGARNSKNTSILSTRTPTPRKSSKNENLVEHQSFENSPYTPTCTPNNNVSIVTIDTPLEKTTRSSKLSKTFNTSIDESELTTPPSALKGKKNKSLPYKPITEDISPASPVKQMDDNSFKTPYNTPGLFDNIRESVLKSRSRLLKTTSTLSFDLANASPEEKGMKRQRESTGDTIKVNKKRRVADVEDQSESSFATSSFGSFHSEDVIPELSKLDVTATPPPHFEKLTEKPVITVPQTKALNKYQKKAQKSPKNDLSDVAGLKKLLKTPKPAKSPSNDLTDVRGVKNLMATPKPAKSPKNDLRDVAGVKKLLATPKSVNSPKNDLTNVAGVKKLMATPKKAKSPKNDLTNIVGVKQLLATPNQMKSPNNDLTNIFGVRNLMKTPRTVNPAKDDLTDVAGVKQLFSPPKDMKSPKNDLTNIGSLRRLMSTPKQLKSPNNDLSDVEGVSNLFSVHRNSITSDQENNEDLFAKLFDKRPMKTYRGKSMSPHKKEDMQRAARKTLGDVPLTSPRVENWVKEQAKLAQEHIDRKTKSNKRVQKRKQNLEISQDRILSDSELKSPMEVSTEHKRRKKMTEGEGLTKDVTSAPKTPTITVGATTHLEASPNVEKRTRGRNRNKEQIAEMQEVPPRRVVRKGRGKVVKEEEPVETLKDIEVIENPDADEGKPKEEVEPKTTRRGRGKKVVEKKEELSVPENTDESNIEVQVEKTTKRGRGKKVATEESENQRKEQEENLKIDEPVIVEEQPQTTRRGKAKKSEKQQEEKVNDTKQEEAEVGSTRRGRGKKLVKDNEKSSKENVNQKEKEKEQPRTKGRKLNSKQEVESQDTAEEAKEQDAQEIDTQVTTTRRGGRAKKMAELVSTESPAGTPQKTRSRRKVDVVTNDTKVTVAPESKIENEMSSTTNQKRGRGKKQNEASVEEEENTNAPKTRGRRNVAKDVPQEQSSMEETHPEPVSTTTRGRGRKKVEPETKIEVSVNEEPSVEKGEEDQKAVAGKRGRRVKAKEEKETPSVESKKDDGESVGKRNTGKRNAKTNDAKKEDAAEEEIKSKKKVVFSEPLKMDTPTRLRRRNAAAQDIEATEPATKRTKQSATRKNEDSQTSSKEETRERRTRRK